MIRHLALVEHLVDLLRERVGAPLSINNLREDLQVEHRSVATGLRPSSVCMWSFRCFRSAAASAYAPQGGQGFFLGLGGGRHSGSRFENFVAGIS